MRMLMLMDLSFGYGEFPRHLFPRRFLSYILWPVLRRLGKLDNQSNLLVGFQGRWLLGTENPIFKDSLNRNRVD